MDSKKKFTNLNSTKKFQQQTTDRCDPFSNYIQFSPNLIQEKLVSDYNFHYTNLQAKVKSQDNYERSYYDQISKLNSRKIHFNLNGNEILNPSCCQNFSQTTISNDSNQNNIKGILKSSNFNNGRSDRETFSLHCEKTYYLKENVRPTFMSVRGGNNEKIIKKNRLAEIKEKLRNSARFVPENQPVRDPFSNYIKSYSPIPQPNNVPIIMTGSNISHLTKYSTNNDAHASYIPFVQNQKNTNNTRITSSARKFSNTSNQKDPFANYFSMNEQTRYNNILNQTQMDSKVSKKSNFSTGKEQDCFKKQENSDKKLLFKDYSANNQHSSNNSCQKISNDQNFQEESKYLGKDVVKENQDSNGALTCKIYLRNPQAKHKSNESRENENFLRESNFQNNKVNFISKSCLMNEATKVLLENNNGRMSAFECERNNNSRSSSLPQKYTLTDVKKAIIFSKITPIPPHVTQVRNQNNIAKNNIKKSSDNNHEFTRPRFNQENVTRNAKPENLILNDSLNQSKSPGTNVRPLSMQNNETYQARKSDHENAAKLMNNLMKKLNDYFNDEFEKLNRFNQFMYARYIENKKRLRNDILEDLTKLTKFEQEVLLDYCKRLYSKSAKSFEIKPKSHSGIENILESYDSQSDLRQKSRQSSINIRTSNFTPDPQPKSPWDLNELKNYRERKSVESDKYFMQDGLTIKNGGDSNKSENKLYQTPTNIESNLNTQKSHALKSISIDNDFKKYIDGIRVTLNSEKIKDSLNSNLNMEKSKNASHSQNRMNFTLNGEKKPYLKDQHKTSDYSTGSDTCTYSKLSENKYLDSNSKEGFSSSTESKMDLFNKNVKNKIEVVEEGIKKVITYSSLIKSIGEIGKPLNNPIYESKIQLADNDTKKSLKIEIINNSSKTAQRKRDLSSARYLNSQNLIKDDKSNYAKSEINRSKVTPYVVASDKEELKPQKNDSIEDFTKNFAHDNIITNKRLSQIEMKFLNLRRNIEMYSETDRVYI
jgi:hypothetical protein